MKTKIHLTGIVILLFWGLPAASQEWPVPGNQLNMENPLPFNLENVQKGKDLYQQNCKSCHGDPGKNNHLPLVPPPPDIVSEQMQANTDGGLFYKITSGRGGMPQFETTISEDDRR
jgi:cytochrome c5